tara:strand:- start:769 stop:1245 length:477 start_codon:yes stop_codon:yes gene_type:complete
MNDENFFMTTEYRTFKKIAERCCEMNTDNNHFMYLKSRMDAMFLCEETYNKIGWDAQKQGYSWDNYAQKQGSRLIKCYTKLFEQYFYISEDLSRVMFKSSLTGRYCTYTYQELQKLKNKTKLQIQQAHNLKMEFEGELVGQRIGTHIKNKKVAQRTRR